MIEHETSWPSSEVFFTVLGWVQRSAHKVRHKAEEQVDVQVDFSERMWVKRMQDALRKSEEELVEVERHFSTWVARQRVVLSGMADLPPGTSLPKLVAEAERLRSGAELEDLLRGISLFPSALDRSLMQMWDEHPSQQSPLQVDFSERMWVKRIQTASGACVQHEWSHFYYSIENGVILLFQSADRETQPVAVVSLEDYWWEHAEGENAESEALEFHLCAADVPPTLPACAPPKPVSIADDTADKQEVSAQDPVTAQSPSGNNIAEHPVHQDSIVGRWAGALSLKLRPLQHMQAPGGEGTNGESATKKESPQQMQWWKGILGKLGGKDSSVVNCSEVWLRAESEYQARSLTKILEAHCRTRASPAGRTTAPNTTSPGQRCVSRPREDLTIEKVSTMDLWDVIGALNELDLHHEPSSAAQRRLSELHVSLGAPAVEALLPQMTNMILNVHLSLLAADTESAHLVIPQRSLEVWLIDEMTVNLHLGLLFGWTLDAGAPAHVVPSILPPSESSSSGTLGYISGNRPQSAFPGVNLLGAGRAQGLGNAVGAVGGAALSGVARGLSLVSVKSAGTVAEQRAKAVRHEAYRNIRMRAETASLAGRRIGKEQGQAEGTTSEMIFQRLCKEDLHMRQLYGEKCPFEPLNMPSGRDCGGASQFALDCIKEELTRRKEFIEAQRTLIEQLTHVSATLAGVPKDARAEKMSQMLKEVHSSLPTGAYIPLCHSTHKHEVVVALVYEEAVCLSTFERAPYAVAAETVSLPHTLQHTYSVVRSVELLHFWLHLRLQQQAPGVGGSGEHQEGGVPARGDHVEKLGSSWGEFRGGVGGGFLEVSATWASLPSVVTWSGAVPRAGKVSEHVDVTREVEQGRRASGECSTAGAALDGEDAVVETLRVSNDEVDDAVVLVTPRDARDSRNEVVDEGVGLGWWFRPRKDTSSLSQNGDVSVLDKVFGEPWASRSERRRKLSVYGAHDGWCLRPLIIKAGDDLRQEAFAMQLISCIRSMWADAGLALRVKTYEILATSPSTGLMEMVPDTVSLAALRKRHMPFVSLENFYYAAFGDGSDGRLQQAQNNFVRSMAAYSLICYILKVKDRHDGNILLERDGSVLHIDWGYMLGRSMNAVLEVERAPFKLTRDHVAVMGGETHANFISYISLCVQGLQVLRERGSELVDLVRAMNVGAPLSCVNEAEIAELQERLALKYSEKEVVERFILLQGQALRSWSTGAYDLLQTFLGV